jgi:hypothetical protein
MGQTESVQARGDSLQSSLPQPPNDTIALSPPEISKHDVPPVNLNGVIQGVERIQQLEIDLERKLDLMATKKKELAKLEKELNELIEKAELNMNSEVKELETLNENLYEANMKELKEAQEAKLEALILHVNTNVLYERRLMQREDAAAFVLRERDNVWNEGYKSLVAIHKQEAQQQLSIARQAYEKKYSEIVSNLQAEYAEAVAKAQANQRENKKRASGGFMDWFSPSKKARASEEVDEDSDSSR